MEIKKNTETQPNSYYYQSKPRVCSYCGQSYKTVFVHGHEQCIFCKINLEPCCQGDSHKSSCLV